MKAIRRLAVLILAAAPAVLAAARLGADPESELNARWRGGWVIVKPAIASNCDGFYNDNDVAGDRADSRARRRFQPGELARVERVELKRSRVDVYLDLAEGVLEPRQEGPFTLYDARTCKVQLRVPVRAAGEAGDRLAALLERHGAAREAEASKTWNGRRREPFPEDYEQTLAEYRVWKAAQANAAVQARMDRAIEDAARVKERIRDDPEYLSGFAAGVEKVRDHYFGDCGSLVNDYFSPGSPSGGRGSDWKRGYEDGQRLAYSLELLDRLRGCFVPVGE
jgi:hypothetical protein